MRLLAPLFVVTTIVLFGSGVAMGLLHGNALQIARRLHGPAAVIWLLLLGLHVLVYLGRALRSTRRDVARTDRSPVRGKTARLYVLASAVVCGLVVGAAFVPAQHRWVDLPRDHHDRKDGAASLSAVASYTQAATTVSAPSTRKIGASSTRRSRSSAARFEVWTNASTRVMPATRASVSSNRTSWVPMP